MTVKRWIQVPGTGELVPAEEYVRPGVNRAPMISTDWVGDFTSPVDDRPLHGKKQWREDLKRHNCVPYESGMKEHQQRMLARENAALEKRIMRTVEELANR